MKKSVLALIAGMVVMMTSCEKIEISPTKPIPREKLIECRTCDATWDISDPTP
jgi:hypothetical protein